MEADNPAQTETEESSTDLAAPCPNCGALNAASAGICPACGVLLASFAEAVARIRSQQRRQVAGKVEVFTAIAAEHAAEEASHSRRQFAVLLALAVGAAAVVLLGVGVFAGLRAYGAYTERQGLRRLEANAEGCLAREDYDCAQDGFTAYLKKQPHDLPARSRLDQAQIGLARRYDGAHNWVMAEKELDALLLRSPGDPSATDLLAQVYDDWSADAAQRGDWLTVALIRLKRTFQLPGGG